MAETETAKALLVRAWGEGLFFRILEKVVNGLGVAAEKFIDQITQDVFNVKGHWDDTVVNIIKAMYRNVRGEEAYQALMRLIGFLTEPEHQEFGVISIGVLAFTQEEKPSVKTKAPEIKKKPGKGKEKGKEKEREKGREEKKPLSVVEKNFALFLDFDFQNEDNYTTLFASYDFLISDFLQLETKDRANRETVVRLMRLSSLYADNTVKKRLAGALMHVRDWPATLKRWREKGWNWIVDSFQAVGNYLNTELDQPLTELEQNSADVLASARHFFNNSRR